MNFSNRLFKIVLVTICIMNIISLLLTGISSTKTEAIKGIKEDRSTQYTLVGQSGETTTENEEDDNSVLLIIKKSVAFWYYVIRLASIAIMLVILIFIGIKMAISTIASEKALYKRMLTDWVAGLIIVFTIHYIMIAIINFNELLVGIISGVNEEVVVQGLGKQFGISEKSNVDIELSIYEAVRTRAYDAKLINGTTGTIMYMLLVYYAVKFTFIYLKRYLTIIILTLMAPAVAVSYAINKVLTGKSKIFSTWLTEYFMNVIIQSLHAILYTSFVSTALIISLNSISGMILAFILLNFMFKAEKLFRKIFKMSEQGSLAENVSDKSGIKQVTDSLKAGTNLMLGNQIAKGVGKAGRSVVTKPLRAAGNAVLSEHMLRKGRKLDKTKDEREEQVLGEELYKEQETSRLSDTIKESEERLSELESNDKDGDVKQSQEYIDLLNTRNVAEQELFDLENPTLSAKEILKAKLSLALNPDNYTTVDENGKRHKLKTTKDDKSGVPIPILSSKFNIRVGKKTSDSVGMRLRARLNTENLLGLTSDDKEVLKEGKELIKSATLGFLGCMVGLPAMIDEPAIGIPILAYGISKSKKAWGKSFTKPKTEEDRHRYTFRGYGPGAVTTMSKASIEGAKEQQDNMVTSNVRMRHPKLYKTLSTGAKFSIGTAKIGAIAIPAMLLGPVGMIGGVAAVKFTGRILRNVHTNATNFRYNVNKQHFNQLMKKTEQIKKDETRAIAKIFVESIDEPYMKERESIVAQVENEDIENIIRRQQAQRGETLEIDGTTIRMKEVAPGAEEITTIIDHALIDVSLKHGIIDTNQLSLDNGAIREEIRKEITETLEKRGIIEKDADIDSEIKGLEGKIKDRKAILDKENTVPTEQKIVSETMTEYMQEKKIKNSDDLTEENIEEIQQIVEQKILNIEHEKKEGEGPSKATVSVTDRLSQQKTKINEEQEVVRDRFEGFAPLFSEQILNSEDIILPREKVTPDETAERSKRLKNIINEQQRKMEIIRPESQRKLSQKEIDELRKREIVRRTNELKSYLEKANQDGNDISTDSESGNTEVSENTLAMLFIIKKLRENNEKGERVYAEIERSKKVERRKLDYSQRFDEQVPEGNTQYTSRTYGDQRYDSSKAGDRKVTEPITDLTRLINSLGKNSRSGDKK